MRKFLIASVMIFGLSGFADGGLPYCAESVLEIDLDDNRDMGFSANDLLHLASGRHELDWVWDYKDGSTALSMFVRSVARTARFIDSVAVYPEGANPDVGIVCTDRLEVDAWIDFVTADGAFSERWYTALYATDGTDCESRIDYICPMPGTFAKFYHGFDHKTINGTFYGDVPVPEDVSLNFYAQGTFYYGIASALVSGLSSSCTNDICYADFIHGGHTP